MELKVGEIYRVAVVQRPLLGLVALLGFIQGYRNFRSSESVVLDQQWVPPLAEEEMGMELKAVNVRLALSV